MDEHLEDGARLLVDETGDALHTSTASETGGGCGGLGEAMPWISLPFLISLRMISFQMVMDKSRQELHPFLTL
jgi:hypothetical protein